MKNGKLFENWGFDSACIVSHGFISVKKPKDIPPADDASIADQA